MLSRDFLSQLFPANVRAAVLTDPSGIGPLPGRYWDVHQLTIFDSDANGQIYNAYLVDQNSYSVLQAAIASAIDGGSPVIIPDFPEQTSGSPLPGIHKLGPGSGLPGADSWATEAQRGGGGSLTTNTGYSRFIIPSGWSLYVVETNGVVSGLERLMLIRIAYNEIASGCSPFKDGPWWG